jgi:hypothetical protein
VGITHGHEVRAEAEALDEVAKSIELDRARLGVEVVTESARAVAARAGEVLREGEGHVFSVITVSNLSRGKKKGSSRFTVVPLVRRPLLARSRVTSKKKSAAGTLPSAPETPLPRPCVDQGQARRSEVSESRDRRS